MPSRSYFSSHMVLQQGGPLSVWGQSPPFETIRVSLADAEVSSCADATGRPFFRRRWLADLTFFGCAAHGDPSILRISGSARSGFLPGIDLGDPIEIHPPNKKEYARRALACVNANVYHQQVPWCRPSLQDWENADGTVRLAFDCYGRGLDLRENPHGSGFTLAGADGIFFAAHAGLEEAAVLVWHEAVKQPSTLRYAWADNPPVTLFDQEGWRAAPFCINLQPRSQPFETKAATF